MDLSEFDPVQREKENTQSNATDSNEFWTFKPKSGSHEQVATPKAFSSPIKVLLPPSAEELSLLRSVVPFRTSNLNHDLDGTTPATQYEKVTIEQRGTSIGTGSLSLGSSQMMWIGQLKSNLQNVLSLQNSKLRDRTNSCSPSVLTPELVTFAVDYNQIENVSVSWDLGQEPKLLFSTTFDTKFEFVVHSGTCKDGEYFDPYDCLEHIQKQVAVNSGSQLLTPMPSSRTAAILSKSLQTTDRKGDRRKSIDLEFSLAELSIQDSDDELNNSTEVPVSGNDTNCNLTPNESRTVLSPEADVPLTDGKASRRQSISFDVLEQLNDIDDCTINELDDFSVESVENSRPDDADSSCAETLPQEQCPTATKNQLLETVNVGQNVTINDSVHNEQQHNVVSQTLDNQVKACHEDDWKLLVRNYVKHGPESREGTQAIQQVAEKMNYPLEYKWFKWNNEIPKPKEVSKREMRKLKPIVIGMDTQSKKEQREIQQETCVTVSYSKRKGYQYVDTTSGEPIHCDEYRQRYMCFVERKLHHSYPDSCASTSSTTISLNQPQESTAFQDKKPPISVLPHQEQVNEKYKHESSTTKVLPVTPPSLQNEILKPDQERPLEAKVPQKTYQPMKLDNELERQTIAAALVMTAEKRTEPETIPADPVKESFGHPSLDNGATPEYDVQNNEKRAAAYSCAHVKIDEDALTSSLHQAGISTEIGTITTGVIENQHNPENTTDTSKVTEVTGNTPDEDEAQSYKTMDILDNLPDLFSFREDSTAISDAEQCSRKKLLTTLRQLELKLHNDFDRALQQFHRAKQAAMDQFANETGSGVTSSMPRLNL